MEQMYSVTSHAEFPLHRWWMDLKNKSTFQSCLRNNTCQTDVPPCRCGSYYLNIQKLDLRSTMKKYKLPQIKLGKNSFIILFHDWDVSFCPVHPYHLTLPSRGLLCEFLYFTSIYTHLHVYILVWDLPVRRTWQVHSFWAWVTSVDIKKKRVKVGEVTRAWNPSIWEAKAEDSGIPDWSWLHNKTLLKRKVKVVS